MLEYQYNNESRIQSKSSFNTELTWPNLFVFGGHRHGDERHGLVLGV